MWLCRQFLLPSLYYFYLHQCPLWFVYLSTLITLFPLSLFHIPLLSFDRTRLDSSSPTTSTPQLTDSPFSLPAHQHPTASSSFRYIPARIPAVCIAIYVSSKHLPTKQSNVALRVSNFLIVDYLLKLLEKSFEF